MTRIVLLENLKEFTESEVSELMLPVAVQSAKEKPTMRAAKVHLMRLPNSRTWEKKAPYIIIQVLTGIDQQLEGQREDSAVVVRFVFCLYCENEQEGALNLMNLMERLRIALLKKRVIGGRFRLDLTEGVETMIYGEEKPQYFGGEMVTTWHIPAVQREVCPEWQT